MKGSAFARYASAWHLQRTESTITSCIRACYFVYKIGIDNICIELIDCKAFIQVSR